MDRHKDTEIQRYRGRYKSIIRKINVCQEMGCSWDKHAG